jgi:hypothetical protein
MQVLVVQIRIRVTSSSCRYESLAVTQYTRVQIQVLVVLVQAALVTAMLRAGS